MVVPFYSLPVSYECSRCATFLPKFDTVQNFKKIFSDSSEYTSGI